LEKVEQDKHRAESELARMRAEPKETALK